MRNREARHDRMKFRQVLECGSPLCTSHAFCKPEVAQVSNLLCRRLPVGRACELRSVGGLEIRDTADWKSALRGCVRQDACKVQRGLPHSMTLSRCSGSIVIPQRFSIRGCAKSYA